MSVVAASAFGQASTDSIETEGIRFGTGASIGAITEKMRITQDGLVGIGYQSPTTPLRVSGTAAMDTALLIPRSVTSAQGGGGNFIASGTTSVSTSNVGTIKFETSGSQRMVIDSSGNVGIETTGPSYRLDVSAADQDGLALRSAGTAKLFFDPSAGGAVVINNNDSTGFYFQQGGSNKVVMDSSGKVGIGTTGPGQSLSVVGNAVIGAADRDASGNAALEVRGSGQIDIYAAGSGIIDFTDGTPVDFDGRIRYDHADRALQLFTTQTERLRIDSSGNVGIGTTTPGSYKLYVAGNAWTTGTWGSSDRRWKENVHDLEGGLAAALALHPVTFTWISGTVPAASDSSEQVGLIAQDVEKVMPQLVRTNDDGFKAVAYDKLSVVAIEAIKELKADNDNLRAELNALKKALGK